MVFNSVVFLFCFLPLSLLLYYLVPGRAKNAVLLAESLIFYCWTGVAFLPLIAVLIVFNYLWALLTARAKSKLRGLLPLAAVLVNLGVLVYFKYANFLIDTVNQVAHLGLAALNIARRCRWASATTFSRSSAMRSTSAPARSRRRKTSSPLQCMCFSSRS